MEIIKDLPEVFEEFAEQRQKSFLAVKQLKDKGIPVIGSYCTYFPKEIAMAMGAATVSLCSTSDETIPAAEKDLPRNLCPLIKSSYGFAKTDKCPFFYFSDVVVGETTCDGKKKMYEYMGEFKEVFIMELPQSQKAEVLDLWKAEILRFKEYLEEKFEVRNLAIVTDLPAEPAVVHVDGRRMWRVLENIYGNAAKYAMPGTRVYATLKTDDTKVKFSLKNVSEHQLNIQAEELTERFIRGDISRSTEGSGLGLSIAKSLTTMQGGTFDLYLDGDLFRVDITFPRVKAKGNAAGATEESKKKSSSGVS